MWRTAFNKMIIVPLQLKVKNSYNEINTLANNNRVMLIYSNDKELTETIKMYRNMG